jgi:hypothetical protein
MSIAWREQVSASAEQLSAGKSLNDRFEKSFASTVEPVKILEEDHRRLASAPHLRHPLDH